MMMMMRNDRPRRPNDVVGSSRPNGRRSTHRSITSILPFLASALLILVVARWESLSGRTDTSMETMTTTTSSSSHRRLLETTDIPPGSPKVKLFYDVTAESSVLYRKFRQELAAAESLIEVTPLDVTKPSICPPGPSERIQELLQAEQYHLALEILKYCAVAHGDGNGFFIDAGASVLVDTLPQLLQGYGGKNIAVLNDPFLPSSIHGGLLFFHPNHAATNIAMAKQMLEILVSTKIEGLLSNPTLLPKSLYDLMTAESSNGSQLTVGPSDRWYFLQHTCIIEPLGGRQVTAPISVFALQSYR